MRLHDAARKVFCTSKLVRYGCGSGIAVHQGFQRLCCTSRQQEPLYVKVKDKKGYGLPSKLMPTAHPALITCGDLVCGISVVFRDFDMKLMIAGTGLEFDHLHLKSTHVFRPRFINFFRDEDVFGIGFAWTNLGENGGQSMWLSRGTKATPPCLIESPE